MDIRTPKNDKLLELMNGKSDESHLLSLDALSRQLERERAFLINTLMKIAMQDYRGNRSTESQLAYDAITSMGYAPHK